jgi:aspartate carbamoyltransferase regulatory subunit
MNVTLMSELEILNAALAVGWVKFSYYKVDGTHRVAVGTRNAALIEQIAARGKKQRDYYVESVTPYFDLSRGDFRCFRNQNFDRIELERLTPQQAVIDAMTIAYAMNDVSADQYHDVVEMCNDLVGADFVSAVSLSLSNNPSNLTDNEQVVERISQSVARQVRETMPHCFVTTEQKVSGRVTEQKKTRAELIAELLEIRKRESEILVELLK